MMSPRRLQKQAVEALTNWMRRNKHNAVRELAVEVGVWDRSLPAWNVTSTVQLAVKAEVDDCSLAGWEKQGL